MAGDQLSEVFDLIEIRGVVSGGFAGRGRWATSGRVQDPLKFFAVVSGRVRLTTDGVEAPIVLEPGDVAIATDRSWLRLEGGTGDSPPREILPEEIHRSTSLRSARRGIDDIVIGIAADLNPAGRTLLPQALPPVGQVRASAPGATNLRPLLDRLFDEVTGGRSGAAFAIRQYGQLLLLEVLRAWVDQAELPPGWLRVLTDERLGPALRLMHGEPGKPWGLAELARAAAMSRTSFAARFRTVAGVPPLAYLNRWRMLLARRALRDGQVGLRSLASELGYGSESAFSTAFKREVGESPLRYRRRLREAAPTRAGSSPAHAGRGS